MKINLFTTLLIIALPGMLAGQEEPAKVKPRGIVPDRINVQFAGNIGFLSIGGGYVINPARTLCFDAAYGYSPHYETGRAIHNLIARFTWEPEIKKFSSGNELSARTSLLVSRQIADEDRTFTRLPKNYPDGYYAPNAFRVHLDLGGSYYYEFNQPGFIRAVEFYAVTTTNEMYVTYLIKSAKVSPSEIFSLAVGVNLILFE